MTSRSPLALVITSDATLMEEVLATVNDNGYISIGCSRVVDVPMPVEKLSVDLAVLELNSENKALSEVLQRGGIPVVLTALSNLRTSKKSFVYSLAWLKRELARLPR